MGYDPASDRIRVIMKHLTKGTIMHECQGKNCGPTCPYRTKDYAEPGTILPNGAVVIHTKGDRVFAILPGNTVTPWVSWAQLDRRTGDCYSGTYYYTWDDAARDWATR